MFCSNFVVYNSKMKKLGQVLKLIISPRETWSMVLQNTSSVETERTLYYPLLALLAISAVGLFWKEQEPTVSRTLVYGLINFISYFLGYIFVSYIMSFAISFFADKASKPSSGKVRTFVMYNMSFLILIDIVRNLLMYEYIFVDLFWLYLLVIIWQSCHTFDLDKEKSAYFIVGSFLLIVFVPKLLFILFEGFLVAL